MRSRGFGGGLFGRALIWTLVAAAAGLSGAAQAETPQTTKYGSWEVQCAAPPGAKAPVCALTQTVRAEEMASANLVVAIRKAPSAPKGVLQLVAPPNVFLLEGLKVRIDQDDIGTIPFFRCTQIGCAAEAPLSDDILNKMSSKRNMLITIYINPGEGLRNIVPLEGFKDGYKALQ